MRTETFTCDECGAQRKEANHWFIALAEGGGVLFKKFGDAHWLREAKHICGEVCAQKILNRWLSKGKI